jgi:phosphatidylglycerol---prolipoprotein diacylglyceryl transferase
LLAYYLHHLSPYVIRFSEGIGIHWYGLAYVMGFYCGYLMLVRLAKQGYGELKPEQCADFITYAALFGVVLGGRIGYMLLYNFPEFLANPATALRLWDGGMASHGGIAGLVLFTYWWSWKHKVSWTGLGDNLVVAAPIGIFFGRIANFINGELYGRITNVPWAMKFPTEVHDPNFVPATETALRWELLPRHSNEIIAAVAKTPEGVPHLEAILHARHPSQLYAAALEGLFLFLVLYLVRTRTKNLPNGMLTGLFFIVYAVVRIFGEYFREPDSSLIMGITKGQFYSLFMILIGAAFIAFALLRKPRVQMK